MERDRSGKVIAIVALLVGVVGLTIGFAAFSNTLRIQSSAEVIQSQDAYNVDFSSASNGTASTATNGSVAPSSLSPATDGPTGSTATIDNSSWDPVISNLKATFTAPGQSVTYTFYTKNVGKMKAYLNSVTFKDTTTTSGTFQTCAPLSRTGEGVEANPATVDLSNICNDITLTLTLGSEDFTSTRTRTQFATATAHDLEIAGYEQVTVVIAYAANPAEEADGDFSVTFGDIELGFSSQASGS